MWLNALAALGHRGIKTIATFGRAGLMLFNAVVGKPEFRKHAPLLVRQLYNVGVLSMLIIIVSGLFIGMVLGLQGYLVLTTYSAETSLGMLVALSLLRELGPVVAALLFAGRAGSALTAEIGLMRATEQLSSMEMMAVDPLRRVISPRFWAGVISLPLLTIIFVAVGVWGGSLVGVSWKGENVTVYHQTPALAMRQENGGVRVTTLQGTIRADQAMLATNALSRELSPTVSRQASMATYASITAPLTPEQRQRLPAMESWGLTPVNAIAGATLRYTHDHRFLVRQHVDPALRGVITAGQTASAARQHLALFHTAYPQLQDVPLERTWSGTISVTRNGAPVWGRLAPQIWTAGGCNGAGVSKQTIAGTLLADLAMGQDNPLIAAMQSLGQANVMPPSPFLDIGVAGALWKERYVGRKEMPA